MANTKRKSSSPGSGGKRKARMAVGKAASAKGVGGSRKKARSSAARPAVARSGARKTPKKPKSGAAKGKRAKPGARAMKESAKPVKKSVTRPAAKPPRKKKKVVKVAAKKVARAANETKRAKAAAHAAKRARVVRAIPPKPSKSKKVPRPVPPAALFPTAEKAPSPSRRRQRSAARPYPEPLQKTALAAWIPVDDESRPRSSSFIPVPPKLAAPSVVVAPPASSDRLFRRDDLQDLDVRSFPVRIEVRQDGGRISVILQPEDLELRVGDGVEWDIRYLGGADLFIERVEIDFDRPGPFPKTGFKSKKPSSARPHRILSGASKTTTAGRVYSYVIHCSSALLVREASAKGRLTFVPANGAQS